MVRFLYDHRRQLESVFTRLSAAADLDQEVTLSSEEAGALVRWIRNERYRHRTNYPPLKDSVEGLD